MPWDNPLFWIPIISGPVFVLAGWILLKYPPKAINGLYGYRTPSSMKNQERWDFAQPYSAKALMKWGGLLTPCGLIGLFYHPSETIAVILGLAFMVSAVILLIVQVEKAIQKRFGDS